MTDYHLKFPDEATATRVLFEDEMPKYTYIDQIGVIYKPTGNADETAPIGGWHVNVRHAEEAPELADFVVVVNNPVRVWA
jgi:hypothetical protein